MDKKGAIEFSMTTVIVVIIGVTILALAIPWVSNVLRGTSELTDTAFEQAKAQLAGELGPNNPVIVSPGSLKLNANEQATVSVGCYNTGGSVSVPTLTGASATGLTSGTSIQSSSAPSSIPVGGEAFWAIAVRAGSGVGRTTNPDVRTLIVTCSASGPITKPLTITYE